MDNIQISRILYETAFWMEMAGENAFAIRAHSRAGTTIKRCGRPVTTLLREKKLQTLPGIGAGLAKSIEEYVTTGKLQQLEELRSQFPRSLYGLLRIPDLGTKSIRLFYETLGIATLESLKENSLNGELAKLRGFGKKKIEKLLAGISFAEAQEGKFLLPRAERAAEEILTFLKTLPQLQKCAVTGDLRRYSVIVEELHFIVLSSEADTVLDALKEKYALQPVEKNEKAFPVFQTPEGIPFHLSFVDEASHWIPLMLASTGCAEHLAQLKTLCKDNGISWEGHVLTDSAGKTLNFETEEAFYEALSQPAYPPEVREKIQLISSDRPLDLVESSDIRGLVHCHSTWSDGAHSVEEMALASSELGYEYMLITDHSRSSVVANGLSEETIIEQHQEIDRLNVKLNGIRVLKGIEADILRDGSLDYGDDILKTFDWVIASVHNGLDMTEKEATDRLIRAIEHPYTAALGHPSGRQLLLRPAYDFDLEKILDAAVANQVALEINASPRRLDLDWRYIRLAAEKGVQFIISPDAHRIAGLQNVRFGVAMARKGGLSSCQILNSRSEKEFLQWQKKP